MILIIISLIIDTGQVIDLFGSDFASLKAIVPGPIPTFVMISASW
jgi:hypothetical protein